MNFNILALIECGLVKQDDNILAMMQNISQEHAHQVAKWLVLATGQPAHLRLMGPGEIEEIQYTPDQVQAGIQQAARKAQDAINDGASANEP